MTRDSARTKPPCAAGRRPALAAMLVLAATLLATACAKTPCERLAERQATCDDPSSAYTRLAQANACICVADECDLAHQLEITLIPENAAQLATAAWGAGGDADEAVSYVVKLLQSYLPNEVT